MPLEDTIAIIKLRNQQRGIKFNAPASPAEIEITERNLGFVLPADFKEFYSICNGFECEEDIFNFLGLDDLLRDGDHGKNWVIFAEYMTYSDVWSLRILRNARYEIFYNDGGEIILTNSLQVFLEKLALGHVFESGGLYEWRDEIKKNSQQF